MSKISTASYDIHIDADWQILNNYIKEGNYSKIIVIVDDNTEKLCLNKCNFSFEYLLIKIPPGEQHKNLDTANSIWKQLLQSGADRKSLVLNLGGGVIGDMGGFCASTFMRGIDFIQIPTTLLSQVDASVGGKLGIDLEQVKNMVGVFNDPNMVWIHTDFLTTLPTNEVRSGYAEVLKHSLIKDRKHWDSLPKDLLPVRWEKIIYHSVEIKKHVVEKDPLESGLRKILNFGHTIGHAIETLSLQTEAPLLHGEAIAKGMVIESAIAHQKAMMNKTEFEEIKSRIESIYGPINIHRFSFKSILDIARKDKKNVAGQMRMSLVGPIGTCMFDVVVRPQEIEQALKI